MCGSYFLQTALLVSSLVATCTSLRCLDSAGQDVDWYITYKTPDVQSASDWKIKRGLALFYLDKKSPTWQLLDQPVNAPKGHAVFNTLDQIYQSTGDSILYLMYNDEHPEENGSSRSRGGHTKGVVASDGSQAFWMVQTTPKFPPKKEAGYGWPHTSYGQTFLCITLSIQSLGKVVHALRVNQPNLYDVQAPTSFISKFPELQLLIKGKAIDGPPWYSVDDLMSVQGDAFKVFAKSRPFGADLYDALVAPTLKEDIFVETWLRKDGVPLDSNCSAPYKVLKVTGISLPDGASFSETKDHAKWAISADTSRRSALWKADELMIADASRKYVCIGDINRMKSQFHRGGGTVCIDNAQVWKTFRKIIAKFQKCS